MKKFIAVIGKAKSGKSTIIKSLTGCPSSNYRDLVRDDATRRSVLAICGSPQEQDLSLDDLRELLKKAAADSTCQGVVMASQPTSPTKRLSIETIFQEASRSFEIDAFILDPNRPNIRADRSVFARVKALSVNPRALDDRRFSIVNADAINRVSRIVI